MKALGFRSAGLLLGLSTLLQAADVTGRWKSEFETQFGHLNYTYDFNSDGEKLTGKATRTQGERITVTEITEGKLAGTNIFFVEMLQFPGRDVRVEYKGEVDGDEIKLTRKAGNLATAECVAKRDKDAGPVAPVAGKWRAEFDTQVGKQKYIYDFKVDGDKLTGKACGDMAGEKFDSEIKDGKIKGAEITFVEMVKFQGLDIRVAYTGTIKGDEIKFIRQVGDVATEEMVAKRVKEADAK